METINTQTRLVRLIDDMEVVIKEVVELMSIPKSQQKDGETALNLMELLIAKDSEVKAVLELAEEQAQIQRVMDALKLEVDKRDGEIKSLQRSLKEAETILATAIFQAKQKLASVNKAREGSISSEEIIKFAHRISASNAVAAPVTWGPGDPRRPYPTDLEMRQGVLGGMNNFPEHARHQAQQHSATDSHLTPMQGVMSGMGSTLSWQPSQEVPLTLGASGSHHGMHDFNRGQNKENEDVELMSSESSSSSSSDEEE